MMKLGTVGPKVNAADATEQDFRFGRQGDQIMSELHGRYAEQVMRGNVFHAATQSPVSLALSHNSTSPTFTLYNPLSSGKMLALIDLIVGFQAPPAAACNLALAAQLNPQIAIPSGLTPGTVRNSLLGSGAASVAAFYTACTLGLSPITVRHVASIVAAASITPPYIRDEIAGAIILLPGISISLQASSAANAYASITWEEIPV